MSEQWCLSVGGLLLQFGADPHCKDCDELSAVDMAEQRAFNGVEARANLTLLFWSVLIRSKKWLHNLLTRFIVFKLV